MKRAAIALRSLLGRFAASVGLEGAFLLLATVCLAVFSTSISAVGPWLVVGAMSFVVFIALALPAKRG